MLNKVKKAVKKLLFPTHQPDPLAGLPPRDRDLIKQVRIKKLTYLTENKLASIAKTCAQLEEKRIPGLFLEAGCALGGSAILMSSLKQRDRKVFVYDVFGMIPPPTEEDTPDVHDRYKIIVEGKSQGIDGDKYYGYEENLYEIVKSNFASFGIDCDKQGVSLIKGLLQDTMSINEPVALAHVDVDWYDPVMACLKRVFPHLSPGGSIILDDYHDWGGCKKATDEFLATVSGQYTLDDSAGSLKVTKI